MPGGRPDGLDRPERAILVSVDEVEGTWDTSSLSSSMWSTPLLLGLDDDILVWVKVSDPYLLISYSQPLPSRLLSGYFRPLCFVVFFSGWFPMELFVFKLGIKHFKILDRRGCFSINSIVESFGKEFVSGF